MRDLKGLGFGVSGVGARSETLTERAALRTPAWCLLTAGLEVESLHVGRPRQRGWE
jgi:hypothetical protein